MVAQIMRIDIHILILISFIGKRQQAVQSVPRLEIKNLTRRFGDTDVVRDVSLSVMPGQVTCLLGPSGCGKSTTLRMIAGIDQQNSGEIWVDGKLICDTHTSIPPEERSIGLMFQDFALFPHLSVVENVAFVSRSNAQKRARVVELLESWSGTYDRRILPPCLAVNNSAWHLPVHWHRDPALC